MPIGPCEPRTWMQHSHIDAQEAGHAFLTLRAQHFIPMHYGTFYFVAYDQAHTRYRKITCMVATVARTGKTCTVAYSFYGQKLFFEMPGEQRTIHEKIQAHHQL